MQHRLHGLRAADRRSKDERQILLQVIVHLHFKTDALIFPAGRLGMRNVSPGELPVEVCGGWGSGRPPGLSDRAAFRYSLIITARMSDIDSQTWLANVLAPLPGLTASQVPDLFLWN